MKNKVTRDGLYQSSTYTFFVERARCFGFHVRGKGENYSVAIDPKRWEECLYSAKGLPEYMKKVMVKKGCRLFRIRKRHRSDYTVNCMIDNLTAIQRRWGVYKKIIKYTLSKISAEELTTDEYSEEVAANVMTYEEAVERTRENNFILSELVKLEKDDLYISLHEAFFHQMASQVEAMCLRAITKNGYKEDVFHRNVFYTFKHTAEKEVKDLDGFECFNKLYSIWHFLKHNSKSTYDKVCAYREVLKEGEFFQGSSLACKFIKFDAPLFESILNGIRTFVIEYCRLVFKEDIEEACWNHEEYFSEGVWNLMMDEDDPCGVSSNPFE